MERIKAGIYGTCVADALGVPVEFHTREQLQQDPVTDMREYGTYHQPRGSWSDDSSMLLCLADSLGIRGRVDPGDIMERFRSWLMEDAYTPCGDCFDCGITVRQAICRYTQGVKPEHCGGTDLYSNGNGSLMRILPLVYGLYNRFGRDLTASPAAMEQIHLVSRLTHGHAIACSACGMYILMAANLLAGMPLNEAVRTGIREGMAMYDRLPGYAGALEVWSRLRDPDALAALPRSGIRSGGYVVDTLEAAVWCLLGTGSYAEAVLLAVNLGADTDTTAAVVGGLAGLAYGMEGIPEEWVSALEGRTVIDRCCESLHRYALQELQG